MGLGLRLDWTLDWTLDWRLDWRLGWRLGLRLDWSDIRHVLEYQIPCAMSPCTYHDQWAVALSLFGVACRSVCRYSSLSRNGPHLWATHTLSRDKVACRLLPCTVVLGPVSSNLAVVGILDD